MRLPSSQRQQNIQATPGSRHTSSINGVAGHIDVASKHESRREEQGEWLEGSRVEGCDQGGKAHWRERRCCHLLV